MSGEVAHRYGDPNPRTILLTLPRVPSYTRRRTVLSTHHVPGHSSTRILWSSNSGQAFTVYQTGQSLTSEQQTIAHYWAAVAAVLTAMSGIRSFTDTLHLDHSLALPLAPRTFSSDTAAEDAAISRLYGGIHYPIGSAKGFVQGRCIGQVIIDRLKFKN